MFPIVRRDEEVPAKYSTIYVAHRAAGASSDALKSTTFPTLNGGVQPAAQPKEKLASCSASIRSAGRRLSGGRAKPKLPEALRELFRCKGCECF